MTPLPPALVDKLIGVAVIIRGDIAEMANELRWFDDTYGDDYDRLCEVLDEIAAASKPPDVAP